MIEDYQGLQVYGVVGDFERHLEHVPDPEPGVGGQRIVALLGGTIGNFPPGTRRNVLSKIATLLGPDDRLLLGTDLVKDPRIIEAAYNDAAGHHRRVQPQPPLRAQPRARRGLPARELRAHRLL